MIDRVPDLPFEQQSDFTEDTTRVSQVLLSDSHSEALEPPSYDPNREQAGTIEIFVGVMNESPSQIGLTRGEEAASALVRLGETEGLFPMPKTTPYFNLKEGRYVYTEEGGWIDMVHFLFYAGRAHRYNQSGEKNPIGEALQEGFRQEFADSILAPHSSYSYEDLPSDYFGADFAVNHFDPESDLTLGEQIASYMRDELKATAPENAPNFDSIPETSSQRKPSTINKTIKPLFTKNSN